MKDFRFFVEKKEGFNIESKKLLEEFRNDLGITKLHDLRLINVYDIFNLSVTDEMLLKIKTSILMEKVTDYIYDSLNLENEKYIAVEYQDGQFDIRASWTKQCINVLVKDSNDIDVKSGEILILHGDISNEEIEKIKDYYINKIESKEKDLSILKKEEIKFNTSIEIFDDFINLSDKKLDELKDKLNLSMTYEDFRYIRDYFIKEKRNPTETEIKVFDTYWSDHCRHTTFETKINDIKFPNSKYGKKLEEEFKKYLDMKKIVSKNKNICLMDMATIVTKYLLKKGELEDLEISSENNACSIYIDVTTVDFEGKESIEKWLLMFKNETHNHPTEIEPFGGASTCLGGAIRDPLSGRAYVYQAIRVSGAANPLTSLKDTLKGKLSQRVIISKAAKGYSSYGNQIGIATSLVDEIYHEGYMAKRLEVGAVVAASPKENVVRKLPENGDVIILLGGKTGRDGLGGATGSSKEHNESSLYLCGAEVQKGNAPEERKIQRLFRNKKATRLIKKCNDFGAGGVCVAIGELADGVYVNLDLVPVKYKGLNGTELAISESQERMAVVVDKSDEQTFLNYAKEENLLATTVGSVTDNKRLVLEWKNKKIVDIDRDFLNTNGVCQNTDVEIIDIKNEDPFYRNVEGRSIKEKILNNMLDLNVTSKKGLKEMFDSTVGASTVLMPYGGKYQATEIDTSILKIPVLDKSTITASAITYGFNPNLLEFSEYYGSIYSIVDSLAKLVSSGVSYKKARLSLQEYFPRLQNDSKKWSKPFIAMLGAIRAQIDFNTPAIGGKDSMSGTFNDIQVPSTLISFAVSTVNVDDVISPEFKTTNSYIYLVDSKITKDNLYNKDEIIKNFDFILENINSKNIISAKCVKHGGIIEALIKQSFGNRIGFELENSDIDIFSLRPGSIVIESTKELNFENLVYLGKTKAKYMAKVNNHIIDLDDIYKASDNKLDRVFKNRYKDKVNIYENVVSKYEYEKILIKSNLNIAKPRVLILVFTGTNSEYDMYNIFNKNGAIAKKVLFRNLNNEYMEESIDKIVKELEDSQIMVIPGGFSAADEPDGSGKFIAAILQNERLKEAIEKFLNRDGLILGICNGFQALVKSGLLPYGKIGAINENSPTLTFNKIGRHISQMVNTRISNNSSPWLNSFEIGEEHTIAVSHGEGRFYANEKMLNELITNNQIATQYVDMNSNITSVGPYNPNGSVYAIEGICSKDGRILGKMGHSERYSNGIYKNIYGNKDQNIFINGIKYFK